MKYAELNPRSKRLIQVESEVLSLGSQAGSLAADLSWFWHSTRSGLESELEIEVADLHDMDGQYRLVHSELKRLQAEYEEISSATGKIYNPRNWFNKEQKHLRASLKNCADLLEASKKDDARLFVTLRGQSARYLVQNSQFLDRELR